jgi:hypothetical protein
MNTDNSVTITMLGGPASGKTCFMLGMYDTMSCGVRGFTFLADPNDDLDLTKRWSALIGRTGADRWPPGTSDAKQYSFKLQRSFKTLGSFNWLDYRGGAIADDYSEKDVQELISHFHTSDGIFIVCPADLLLKSDTVARSQAYIRRINLHLGTLADELDQAGKPKPIITIVLTKYDYLLAAEPDQESRRAKVIDKMKKLYEPLFGGDWLVAIMGVTLGAQLSAQPDTAEIDPQALHFPVVFTLYSRYRDYERRWEGAVRDKIADKNEQQNAHNRKVKDMSSWDRFWNEPQPFNSASHDAEIENYKKYRNEWNASAEAIAEMLKDQNIFVFQGGEEVSIVI